ncbi:hypothetical protein [Syntrophomonas erecta]
MLIVSQPFIYMPYICMPFNFCKGQRSFFGETYYRNIVLIDAPLTGKTFTAKAREENTSLNQYIVYQLARGVGHPVK